MTMLSLAAELASGAADETSAQMASAAFFQATAPYGVSYLQTRIYRRPEGFLTSDKHWAAGGFVSRVAPDGWEGSAAFNYICFECNPLLDAVRGGRTLYRFSDFAPHDRTEFADYWAAMSEARIDDAVCATSYGAARRIATLHIGLAEAAADPMQIRAIQLAGLITAEHLMTLSEPTVAPPITLTDRERDSLALVADGKSDWEISVILGISQSTARFHVDNARRKLGACNRTHAVAKLIAGDWL